MTKQSTMFALFACWLAWLGLSPAAADAIADFYGGRTVTLIVSTSAAGGYDTLARAIAHHIGKHIPGHPTVIVRNMPGAGGLTATNYLYAAAERDGSVLGLVQNNPPFEPLFGTPEARFDPRQFNWLGTPSVETAMVLVWKTVPVFSLDDLRTRETIMGASGANSTPAFFARLFNATLGTRMKVIPGYPGQNDALVAMERGELDGYPSVFYSALSSTRPTWLTDGTARAIVQYGPGKLPQLAGVPFVPDLVGDADKLLLEAAFAPLSIGRPLLMPGCARRARRRDAPGAGRNFRRSGISRRRRQDRLVAERAAQRRGAVARDRARLCGAAGDRRAAAQAQHALKRQSTVIWSARRRRPWRLGRPATTRSLTHRWRR
jgi:tripartite-type tricarboxylate transporter receptor subunit TctC